MESQQEPAPAVILDEHDEAAVTAILMRAIRAQDQLRKDREAIKEAETRVEENTVVLNKAVSALSFFGIEKREGENVWDQVMETLGREAYRAAIARARGAEPAGLLEQMGDDEPPHEEPKEKLGAAVSQRPVAVRDAILRHLRAVGDRGTDVREIKRYLADDYAMTVHEKTPGMTLYRLMKDGLARREGRTWYATVENEGDEPNDEETGADLA